MPKRNGQNPIRSAKGAKTAHGNFGNAASGSLKTDGMIQCPECKADVPPKPGFRKKSLKCPECNASLYK